MRSGKALTLYSNSNLFFFLLNKLCEFLFSLQCVGIACLNDTFGHRLESRSCEFNSRAVVSCCRFSVSTIRYFPAWLQRLTECRKNAQAQHTGIYEPN